MIGTEREKLVAALSDPEKIWDVIVIGGGATGLGTALDAASRGYQTLLLEQADFAKGTSSRSTKLVHGGVRYLAQGDIGLVREALYERGLLLKNAAHLVKNESFIIPNYEWWGGAFYTIGLTLYDLLAGKLGFGRAKHISKKQVISKLGTIQQKNLYGGVVYHDGQFDDARLAVNLAQTCIEQGATVLNYFKVSNLIKNKEDKITGVVCTDIETGTRYTIKGKTVINATGVFVDNILNMDKPERKPMVKPSQGVHIVLSRSFMPGEDALMIPKTDDGRVLFAVPWHDKLVIGTTDTPIDEHSLEPVALQEEIDFIMRTAAKYLVNAPTRKDVLSVFAGLRPLAAPENGSSKTKEISRSHKLIVSASGLITITGGKWTTYRRMGEDTVDKAIEVGGLVPYPNKTKTLPIHGSKGDVDRNDHLYVYGSDEAALLALGYEKPEWTEKLHPRMPYIKAEVIWGVRHEMARSVEDILARRVRALFLDARAAIDMAPVVADLIAGELHKDAAWKKEQVDSFRNVAKTYLLEPYSPAS
ncbi:glycerol-3-phosphate dehydrogenase/oxidase [Mucilaginibacter sp. BJC16-A38]|uniref:glycerol-3-phosphate dehydrogenase/oxidase n=1 Tax=Mucilaginibacter phenanthrenivorans TaxID=1234842 RepID=UPI00215858B5|nr:glycerol-3-phosphate dehydrogenase/oxidase [Mucilaginibacter phenanthrenivorans]MCR8560134.1 glycerol-3-phosphate dehydrogenase/oxidase [Mucilaginibacter phenanthrenivorans]